MSREASAEVLEEVELGGEWACPCIMLAGSLQGDQLDGCVSVVVWGFDGVEFTAIVSQKMSRQFCLTAAEANMILNLKQF